MIRGRLFGATNMKAIIRASCDPRGALIRRRFFLVINLPAMIHAAYEPHGLGSEAASSA